VNRWAPKPTTRIEGVLCGLNSAQRPWAWMTNTGGAGTDSVSWTWSWGSDSLTKGENFLLAVALESDAGTTNNLGLGTPMAGNLLVYPFYRIDQPTTPAIPSLKAIPRLCTVAINGTWKSVPFVRYSLTDKDYVSIRVFNLQGSCIMSLCNGVQPAGYYSIPLPKDKMASGCYVLKFLTGNFEKRQAFAITR
jgi:hypothetical protein